MKIESTGLFVLGFVQVVFGQDCSSLLGSSGKRFILDTVYSSFNKLPGQVKNVLPTNTELSSSCRFDLLKLRDSDRNPDETAPAGAVSSGYSLFAETLKTLYDQGYSLCVGCGYTNSDHGRCHSIDVCKKGSKCIQARNEDKYPTYYWHSCCEDGDSKCRTNTENLHFNVYGRDTVLRYKKTVCQGPLCNENGYTQQKNDVVSFLTQNTGITTATVTTAAPTVAKTTPASSIDGGWTQWSAWGSCDQSCDIGLRFRTRACTAPVPQNGGAYCTGQDKESQLCNINPC